MKQTFNGNAPLIAALLLFVVVLPIWRYGLKGDDQQAAFMTTIEADPFSIIAELK